MKYYNSYKDFLNEKVDNSINEASDEQEALKNLKGADRPKLHTFQNKDIKSDINVYEPLDREDINDIDKYLVFNPETKHFVTIKAFNDYFKKVEAGEITEAVAKGKVVKPTKELKKVKDSIDKIKAGTKKTVDKKETETSKETTKKDKTLKKGDPSKTEVFKKENDLSDSEFDKLTKDNINPSSIKKFKFAKNPGLDNPKYPKRYNKIIERMLNTNRSGSGKFGWSNFSKSAGGAGDISAQGGELLALMGTSMDDKSSKAFYEQMRAHVKEVKAKGLKPTIDESWVDASEKQRSSVLKRILKQYPKGTKVISTCWDTEEEVSAMGLTDYKKNKGFSTDIYLKVKTPDGKEILDEVSLKKSLVINLLNSGTGQFKKWDPKLSDEINQNVYAKKQQTRNNEFFTKNKAAIIKLSKTDKKLAEILAAKKVKIEDLFTDDKISSITKKKLDARAYNNIVYKSIEALSRANNKAAIKMVDATNSAHDEFVSKAYNSVATNKKLKTGMLEDIRNEFPLKSISEGEESMSLGEHSLDKMTLKNIFGTDDFNEIKEGLSVKTDKKTGKSYLAYEAIKGKDTIPIADISIYEDGKGYGGVFKFSLVLAKEFAKKIKEANSKTYGSANESLFITYGQYLFEKLNSAESEE